MHIEVGESGCIVTEATAGSHVAPTIPDSDVLGAAGYHEPPLVSSVSVTQNPFSAGVSQASGCACWASALTFQSTGATTVVAIRLAIRHIHRTYRIHRILLFHRQLSQEFRRFQRILLQAFSLTMEEI